MSSTAYKNAVILAENANSNLRILANQVTIQSFGSMAAPAPGTPVSAVLGAANNCNILTLSNAFAGFVGNVSVGGDINFSGNLYKNGYLYPSTYGQLSQGTNFLKSGQTFVVDGDLVVSGNIITDPSAGTDYPGSAVSYGAVPIGIIEASNIALQSITSDRLVPNQTLSNVVVYGAMQAGVVVASNLYVSGATTVVDALTTVASNLVIDNAAGAGPALSVSQKGTGSQYAVAEFFDSDVSTTVPALMVANGGYVGIGTANPNEKLSIEGSMEIGTSSGDYQHLRMGGGNSSGYLYGCFNTFGDGIHMGYNYYNNNTNDVIPVARGGTSRISMGYGEISLYTGGTGLAPNTLGLFIQNGSVGVGTLGFGGGLLYSALAVNGGTTIGAGYTLNTAPTNGLLVQGNVGIGTTAPGAALHVATPSNGDMLRIENDLIQAFPPQGMTDNTTNVANAPYGNGYYTAMASSAQAQVAPLYGMPWNAFDNSSNSFYYSAFTYSTTSPYNYTGAVYTYGNGTNYYGEWVQLQMPVAIALSSYTITIRDVGDAPSTFYLLGSSDGSSWNLLDQQTSVPWTTQSQTLSFTKQVSSSYTYFRMVVNAIGGGAATLNISNVVFYGTVAGPRVNQDGKVGVGLPKPSDMLEVAGNAIVHGNISAGNLGMFRNRIINGDMRIAQRGTSSTSYGYATVDRWNLNANITTGALQQIQAVTPATDPPFQYGFRNYWDIVVNSACTSYSYIEPLQNIEGLNISDLMWGTAMGVPITVSFWVRTNIPSGSVITCAIRNGTTPLYTYCIPVTIKSSASWQYVVATVPAPPAGSTWNTDNTLGMQLFIGSRNPSAGAGVQASTWQTGGVDYIAGSYDVWATTGNYLHFTGVQLEKGTLATPFEFRPYSMELQLCQRYFQSFGGNKVGYGRLGLGSWANSTNGTIMIIPKTLMRALPTFNSTGLGYVALEGIAWYAITGISLLNDDDNDCFILYFGVASSSAATGQVAWLGQGPNTTYFYFSAEL